MRELLTKEQLLTIFRYLQDYSNLQAWKDLEEYCYFLKTIRMNGAFRSKDKNGVQIVLNAIEANIGSLQDFCKKNNIEIFSFDKPSERVIVPQESLIIEEHASIEQKIMKEETRTIHYGVYEGLNTSIGLFREQDTLVDVDIKEYQLYVDYRGDRDNIISIFGESENGDKCEYNVIVETSGKYPVEVNGIIKRVLEIVCEYNVSILCEVYAVYVVDVKE